MSGSTFQSEVPSMLYNEPVELVAAEPGGVQEAACADWVPRRLLNMAVWMRSPYREVPYGAGPGMDEEGERHFLYSPISCILLKHLLLPAVGHRTLGRAGPWLYVTWPFFPYPVVSSNNYSDWV